MQSDNIRNKKQGFLFHLIGHIAPFFILGVVYFIWLKITEIYVPCLFRQITGYKCPGCGITSMCVNTGAFNFFDAFCANPFIFITLPLIIFEVVYCEFLNFKKRKMPTWNNLLLIFYCIGLIVFGIIRNIIAIWPGNIITLVIVK